MELIYLKSLVAGLGALILAAIATTFGSAVILLSSSWLQPNGGITSVSFGGGPVVSIVAVLIFAAGFWWELRRTRAGLPFLPPLGFVALSLLVVVLVAFTWYYRPTLEGGISFR